MIMAAAAASAAEPPALPFKYLGKWTQNGRTTVFLERDHYPYAARVGQNLDHEFRVDSIESDRMVVTYLPLGTRYVLVFSNEAMPFVPLDPPEIARTAPVALSFLAPNHVLAAQDFLIGVGVRALPGVSASATVELTYDAALLVPVEGAGSGRMSVRVNTSADEGGENKPTVVRFHVLTVNPQTTRIEINAQAMDAEGHAIEIRAPDAHSLRIIP